MDQSLFFYILAHITGIGHRGLLNLLNYPVTTNIQQIIEEAQVLPRFQAQVTQELTQAFSHLDEWHEKAEQESFILLTDDRYPPLLAQIYDPPAILFYEGQLELLQTNCLSVVGSREPMYETYEALNYFVPSLAHDFTIVSGLARGVDSYAHLKTIEAGGNCIAVVANGLDIYYPKENTALQQKIAQKHLLLSEYPQGTIAKPFRFPCRNRIIAGLSMGTVVFQAKRKSGSQITANQALENGRGVYVLPGNALSPLYEGSHLLIQAGAKLTIQPQDIIEEKWLYQS